MWQFWPKIDQDNSDSECMQHMIIPHMLALRYIQRLMATIVSWHIDQFIQMIFVFSQRVIVSLETDRIW